MAGERTSKPKLGLSACLLGERVRYDAGHKRDRFVAEVLPEYFELIPVCPEVEIGLGVPRPPIHLVGDPKNPRAVGVADSSLDYTEPLARLGRLKADQIADMCGYIFKSKSPSCGLERVSVHSERDEDRVGRGVYAAALLERLPGMPAVEEGQLDDPAVRENFIVGVFAFWRWSRLLATYTGMDDLVTFHSRYKLILMARDKQRLVELGRLVGNGGKLPDAERLRRYGAAFLEILRKPATRQRHTDVLFHVMGYLKKVLASDDKRELVEMIEAYRQGELPLLAPVVLLRHHFRRHPHPYVERQYYLYPSPGEFALTSAC